MTRNQKGFAPIILLLFVVLLGFSGYLLLQNSQLRNQSTQSPSETPKSDATTNWKTFSNENISFKYPSNLNENPVQGIGSGSIVEFTDKNNEYSLIFTTRGNYDNGTGQPYLSIQDYASMSYPGNTLKIDGQEGMQYVPRAGSENANSVFFFSPDKKVIYTVELITLPDTQHADPNKVKLGQELFTQILSTFKFTETGDWKIYPTSTTTGLPYQFQYPPTVEVTETQDIVYLKSGESTLYHRFAGKTKDVEGLMNTYKPFGLPEPLTFSNRTKVNFGDFNGYKATTNEGSDVYYFLGESSLNGVLVFNYSANDSIAETLFNQIVPTLKLL